MNQSIELFDFPNMPDEAVIAINDFLKEFYARLQSRYFSQKYTATTMTTPTAARI